MGTPVLNNIEDLIGDLQSEHGIQNNSPINIESFQSLFTDPIIKEQIETVLKAEKELSFFNEKHFETTYPEKELFSYSISKLTSELLGSIYPKYDFKNLKGYIPYNNDFVKNVVNQLNEKGYYVLENGLNDIECDEIISAISDKDFILKKSSKLVKGFNKKNLYNIKGNTCWIENQQNILAIPAIQNLIMNPNFLSIAQEYLGAIPIHCQANCWWSVHYADSKQSLSKNAQLFHQDKEFIKFIKIFIYLNDVEEDNGPHSYISGSHKNYVDHVPENYLFSHRLSDEYLTNQYPKDDIISMTGKKGTIIIEDTSGFHKGVPVVKGYRLLAQLEFCSSMYFNAVSSFTLEGLSPELKSFAKKYPRVFQNYNHERYLQHNQQRANDRKKDRLKNFAVNSISSLVPQKVIDLLKK